MNVAFFIGGVTHSGGTQRMLSLLANKLIPNFGVTIFVHQKGAPFFPLDKRIEICVLKGNLWNKNRQLYREIKRKQIRYYINLDSNTVLLNGFLLPRTTKLIIWEHFSLENNYKKLLFSVSRKYAAIRAHKFIVLSTIEQRLWQKKYAVNPTKIEVIYNPITIDKKEIDQNDKWDKQRVLAIGNNLEVKGFDILIKAWNKIKTTWELHIIGLPEEDRDKLKQLIANPKSETLFLHPKVNNIVEFYKNSSIFVLSSRKEATPLVLIESQAFGLPVVCFNHLSSVKEIAGDSVLYADFDQQEEDLAFRIESLINSKTLYDSYRSKSLQNTEKFTQLEFVRQWERVFNSK